MTLDEHAREKAGIGPSEPKQGDLRVWWIPQVPMKAFTVDVASVAEGVKIIDTLADYDLFQYENNVKPNYCNVGGLLVFDNGVFVDWYFDYGDEYFEDPREYLRWIDGCNGREST